MTAENASDSSRSRRANQFGVPKVPAWFQNGFHRFLNPYLRRHFHAIAVEQDSRVDMDLVSGQSLLIYGNHPSWWDPLIAHFLTNRLCPGRQFFAPIDAVALEQYQVFAKLGFYGVRLNTSTGAAAFLKRSNAILDQPNSALWLTPEGRFTDARDSGNALMPGLAHLCSRRSSGLVMSFALEYLFWNERLPVCLVRFGTPIRIADHTDKSKEDWNKFLTQSLRSNQVQLAKLAMARDSEPFDNLITSGGGAGMSYDMFRRVKSWLRGRRFQAQHGEQFR